MASAHNGTVAKTARQPLTDISHYYNFPLIRLQAHESKKEQPCYLIFQPCNFNTKN